MALTNEVYMNEVALKNEVNEDLIKSYFKTMTDNLSDQQRAEFMAVCLQQNLNPFKREIYATVYSGKMTLITGYEVYLKRAELCPAFDGYETEFVKEAGDLACICRVYRKDRQHPTCSKVFDKEFNTHKSLWSSKPRVMLEKVAIATAFRRCFPNDFGGIPYMAEELDSSLSKDNQEKPTQLTQGDICRFQTWQIDQRERVGEDVYNETLTAFGGESAVIEDYNTMKNFTKAVMKLPTLAVEVQNPSR